MQSRIRLEGLLFDGPFSRSTRNKPGTSSCNDCKIDLEQAITTANSGGCTPREK